MTAHTEPDPADARESSAMEALLREGSLDTGDIVLFNRRCGAMGPVGAVVCYGAKLYGRYDHLGVVVREDDGKLMLIDAGFNGVQYVDLAERIRRSKSHDIAIRRLYAIRTPAIRQAAKTYVEEVRGRGYKQDHFQMIASGIVTPAQWKRERLYMELQAAEKQVRSLRREVATKALSELERAALCRALDEARTKRSATLAALEATETSVFENREDLQGGLFCSELAASAYQRMGLLPRYPSSNHYIPMDFSTSKKPLAGRAIAPLRREGLSLQGGAFLGDEVFVRLKGKDLPASSLAEMSGVDVQEVHAEEKVKDTQPRTVVAQSSPNAALLAKALARYRPTHTACASVTQCSPNLGHLFTAAHYRDGQVVDTYTAESLPPEKDTWVNIIESGEVDVYMSSLDGEDPGLLATFGPGNAFSRHIAHAVGYRAHRQEGATLVCRARGPVFMWKAPMSSVVSTTTRMQPQHTSPSSSEALASVLSKHPYFAELTPEQRQVAMHDFFLVTVPRGALVLEQNERSDNFYVIESGHAEVVRKKGPSTFVVSTLAPGASFGEAASLFNSRRGASVKGTEDLRVWAMSRVDLMRWTRKGSPFLHDFFKQHATKMVHNEALMSYQDFFQALGLPQEKQQAHLDLTRKLTTTIAKRLTRARNPQEGESGETKALPHLLAALDPSASGLISFSEVVHMDIWLNSPAPHVEVALKLAGRDTGYHRICMSDLEALEVAAMRATGLPSRAHDEQDLQKFASRLFRNHAARRDGIPYEDFVAALHSKDCPLDIRRFLGEIRSEVEMVRSRWSAVQPLLRRQTTVGRPVRPSDERPWMDWAMDCRLMCVVVAGCMGGALSRLLVAPLERAKILIQTNRAQSLRDAVRRMMDPAYAKWGPLQYRVFRGLFVGNGLNMARIVPVLAAQVYMYQYLRDRVLQAPRGHDPWEPSQTLLLDHMRPQGYSMEARHMVAGGVAGALANMLIHPLDVIRARITAQQASPRMYNGALDCLRKTLDSEGPRALTRGMLPCALWAFFYIGIHSTCIAFFAPITTTPPPPTLGTDNTTTSTNTNHTAALKAGVTASVLAQTVAYPFDLIRRRMQLPPTPPATTSLSAASGTRPGLWATAREAVREARGMRGLYGGFSTQLIKMLPATYVSYHTTNAVLNYLDHGST